jgi:hypothetical protein
MYTSSIIALLLLFHSLEDGNLEDTVAFDGVWDATNYEYALKGTSSLTTNIQASRENGTVAFEQVLELTLPKLSKRRQLSN